MKIKAQSIVLPTGTSFGICMKNGEKYKDLELVDMENALVAALFPEDNVDFCIRIDNTRSQRGILFTLTINGQSHEYTIPAGMEVHPMQALTTNGRKLHFLNQATEEGKLLVAQTAAKYGMSCNEAAEMCCQLKFEIEVEEIPELVEEMPPFLVPRRNYVQIFLRNLVGATLTFMVDLEDTIDKLKRLIYIKEKILPQAQRLVYTGKELDEPQRKLREYGVSSNSNVHLLLSLKGGRRLTDAPSRPQEAGPNYHSQGGNRGVICYGDKSNQRFENGTPFQTDETYKIKPFVIELRKVPKYAPI